MECPTLFQAGFDQPKYLPRHDLELELIKQEIMDNCIFF